MNERCMGCGKKICDSCREWSEKIDQEGKKIKIICERCKDREDIDFFEKIGKVRDKSEDRWPGSSMEPDTTK